MMYRCPGVNRTTAAKVQQGGCCEPVCGPTTCDTTTEVQEPKADQEVSAKSGGGCCEPECGPTTCG